MNTTATTLRYDDDCARTIVNVSNQPVSSVLGNRIHRTICDLQHRATDSITSFLPSVRSSLIRGWIASSLPSNGLLLRVYVYVYVYVCECEYQQPFVLGCQYSARSWIPIGRCSSAQATKQSKDGTRSLSGTDRCSNPIQSDPIQSRTAAAAAANAVGSAIWTPVLLRVASRCQVHRGERTASPSGNDRQRNRSTRLGGVA